jgi:drug/metabolite transporter (DMT)-like permease
LTENAQSPSDPPLFSRVVHLYDCVNTSLSRQDLISGGMTQSFTPNPRLGLAFTLAGAALFVPDALLVRMIGGDVMDIAVWRGMIGGVTTLVGTALFAPHLIPSWRVLLSWPSLLLILAQGLGSFLYLMALGQTSVANTMLLYASSPFLAALLAFAVLGERIPRMTVLCMAGVFAGVVIIASGSLGGGNLWGDLVALLNAGSAAAYYVILRKTGAQSLIISAALGFFATALLAYPFAPHHSFDAAQIGLVTINGAIGLALGCALQMIGPRHLPAAEVSMITMLEIVASPLLVWAVLNEVPATLSLIGGGVILAALVTHGIWRLRQSA